MASSFAVNGAICAAGMSVATRNSCVWLTARAGKSFCTSARKASSSATCVACSSAESVGQGSTLFAFIRARDSATCRSWRSRTRRLRASVVLEAFASASWIVSRPAMILAIPLTGTLIVFDSPSPRSRIAVARSLRVVIPSSTGRTSRLPDPNSTRSRVFPTCGSSVVASSSASVEPTQASSNAHEMPRKKVTATFCRGTFFRRRESVDRITLTPQCRA